MEPDELRRLDSWWRAANHLAVGQIYPVGTALLGERLVDVIDQSADSRRPVRRAAPADD